MSEPYENAVACIELIAGKAGHVDYDLVPSVIYTAPEVAWVGKTEEQLKAAGVAYKVGKFPFTANSRAKINHETEGFVKILADATTDRVLGVHMMGPAVSEMIAEACVLMAFSGASEDLARIIHAGQSGVPTRAVCPLNRHTVVAFQRTDGWVQRLTWVRRPAG